MTDFSSYDRQLILLTIANNLGASMGLSRSTYDEREVLTAIRDLTADLPGVYLPTGLAVPIESTTTAFTVAHRGGGYVRPEHTLAAYRGAVNAGFTAIEVSVQPLADGTWVCMHDLTLDRTTTLAGTVTARTWPDVKNNCLVDIGASTLGPSWASQPVPTLREVLAELGGKVVMLVEPKATISIALTSDLLALLLDYGPPEAFIWKTAAVASTGGIPATALTAQAAGVKVWAYLVGDESNAEIDATAAAADIVGTLATSADATQEYVVATGKPVIAYPVYRRWHRDHLRSLGVRGIMASTGEYLSRTVRYLTASNFGSGIRGPGDLPYGDVLTLGTWDVANSAMTLPGASTTASLLLGSLCPITATTYTITWDMKWPTLPAGTNHSDLVFGQADDAQYGHQSAANTSGYHVVMRTTGALELYKHENGSTTGTKLGDTVTSDQPVADTWMSLSVTVTPTDITIERTDDASAPMTVANTEFRGGYIHLATANSDTAVHFRSVVVT